jgi:hypothetical protein
VLLIDPHKTPIENYHPEGLKQRILSFGIREHHHWGKDYFCFQAPGGQVFRWVGSAEDMT